MIGQPTATTTTSDDQMRRTELSLMNYVVDHSEANQEDPSTFHCNDPKNPCKCNSKRRAYVDKKDKVHWYTEYSCANIQDSEMFAKLKKAELSFECKQLTSTLVFNYCDKDEMKDGDVIEFNSGCELRYIDAKSNQDQKFFIVMQF